LLSSPSPPQISFLGYGELGTLALGQRYPGLCSLTDDEDVGNTSGECAVERVLDMDNIKPPNMLLAVNDDTSTTHVTATSDHDDVASVKSDELKNFALLEVKLDGVVDLDSWVGVTDGSSIVSDNVGDALCTKGDFTDFEKLVGSLLGSDAVDSEATLDIIQQTEVFTGFFNGNGVHEASGIGGIGPDFPIDLDQALVDDCNDLTSSQSILQPVAEEDRKGKGFTKLVGTRRWAGSVGAAQFVEHP